MRLRQKNLCVLSTVTYKVKVYRYYEIRSFCQISNLGFYKATVLLLLLPLLVWVSGWNGGRLFILYLSAVIVSSAGSSSVTHQMEIKILALQDC